MDTMMSDLAYEMFLDEEKWEEVRKSLDSESGNN